MVNELYIFFNQNHSSQNDRTFFYELRGQVGISSICVYQYQKRSSFCVYDLAKRSLDS